MPGLFEADDLGMYVVKFRGAGQGLKVLVAEVLVGELARRLDIRVPRLVTIDVRREIARYEADEEVQDLLTASIGSNLGVDFLPGSFGYDGSTPATSAEADAIIWLDAYTANVDRTWSNPNLLVWHGNVWTIDHGAALWFHHMWPTRGADVSRFADQPFDASKHVLADLSVDLPGTHAHLSAQITEGMVREVVDLVPEEWLEPAPGFEGPDDVRRAYVAHLLTRLEHAAAWLPTKLGGGR